MNVPRVLERRENGGARDCEGLVVLYEDEWLIAIDKPAGLLSQPGISVSDSVSERVRAARPEAPGVKLAHRLDMDTSGVILLAKDAPSHRHLQQQFERRETIKAYRALLERPCAARAGRLVLPLRLDVDRRPFQIVDTVAGRTSETIWRRVPSGDGHEVVLLPRTGRTHQLRVHAADARGLANPIRGDRLYGAAGGRLCLHAERLGFRHPVDGSVRLLVSPPPFGVDARREPAR